MAPENKLLKATEPGANCHSLPSSNTEKVLWSDLSKCENCILHSRWYASCSISCYELAQHRSVLKEEPTLNGLTQSDPRGWKATGLSPWPWEMLQSKCLHIRCLRSPISLLHEPGKHIHILGASFVFSGLDGQGEDGSATKPHKLWWPTRDGQNQILDKPKSLEIFTLVSLTLATGRVTRPEASEGSTSQGRPEITDQDQRHQHHREAC